MTSSEGQFGRFLLTGLFNTANGYASVLVIQSITGMPILSNFLGYLVASLLGYLAHTAYTFRSEISSHRAFRYVLVLATSYSINVMSLQALLRVLPPVPSQLIAVTIFTLLCYLGHSRFTFRK